MDRVRKREFPYMYSRDKKLFHLVGKLKDVPGSLGDVLALLSKRLNLLGSVSYTLGDGNAIWSAFGEAVNPSESAAALKQILLSSGVVSEFDVTEDDEGLLVDSFHTGIVSESGESYLMMPRNALSHMFDQVVIQFGSGGELLLYNQGTSLGKDVAEFFVRLLGVDLAKRKVAQLRPLLSALGWGVPVRVSEDPPGTYTLRVEDCFECSSGHDVTRGCSFMMGYFAGAASRVIGIEIACKETKCRLKGDRDCEFLIGPKLKS